MAATTPLAVLDSMVREELPAASIETLNITDPLYSLVKTTTDGVKSGGIGRGWNIMHRFHSGVSGLYEPSTVTGGTIRNDALRVDIRNTPTGFPNPSETPHISHYVRQAFLHGHRGNYAVEEFDLKVESLDAAVLEKWATDIKGVAKLIAHTETVSFYVGNYIGCAPATTPEVSGGVATTYTTSKGGGATANASLKIYPSLSRMAYWRSGMYVDIYDDSSLSHKRNVLTGTTTDVPLVVDVVDPVGDASGPFVIVTSVEGRALNATSVFYNDEAIIHATTDNYVVPRGGTSSLKAGHYGLSDWVVNSGTLFGDGDVWDMSRNTKTQALDVGDYPEFKSMITTNLAAPLTETILNQKIAGFVDAFQSQLDTIFTTLGVTMKMMESPNSGTSRLDYDRTGKSLAATFGFQPLKYEWEGRSITWHSSQFMPIGTLYALKLGGGNIKRYVPPRTSPQIGLSAPGTMEGLTGEIEFLAPMSGHPTIFLQVRNSSGRVLPQLEAPFWQFSNILPEDPRAVKIAGITEAALT